MAPARPSRFAMRSTRAGASPDSKVTRKPAACSAASACGTSARSASSKFKRSKGSPTGPNQLAGPAASSWPAASAAPNQAALPSRQQRPCASSASMPAPGSSRTDCQATVAGVAWGCDSHSESASGWRDQAASETAAASNSASRIAAAAGNRARPL